MGEKAIREQSRNHALTHNARWQDLMGGNTLSAALYDLVAKQHQINQHIIDCAKKQGHESIAQFINQSTSPFEQINELLSLGTLPVSLERSGDEEIRARHKSSNAVFSIAQMSDGERNAVILAAQVLTAKKGIVLLIDEPERHLHRSIIEPFLAALFAQREDCKFVVSTHEVALPISNPDARVLVTRSCRWNNMTPAMWDIQLLPENEESNGLPESTKRAILGARRRILFVEGSSSSLDQALYSVLFPDLSVVPTGSCREVQKAVAGLRKVQVHHDVEAFGLIDRDNMTSDEVEALSKNSVYALNVCAAEALYYCSDSIAAVAKKQAETHGEEPNAMAEIALQKAFLALREEPSITEEMAMRRCERRMHSTVLSQIPEGKKILSEGRPEITLQVDCSPYFTELDCFKGLVAERNWDNWNALIASYPLHQSKVFPRIAFALKFAKKRDYERAVYAQARQNRSLAHNLKRRIGKLSERLEQPRVDVA